MKLAWFTAALTKAKRMPSLKRLLNPPKTRKVDGAERGRREREFAELSKRMGTRHGR